MNSIQQLLQFRTKRQKTLAKITYGEADAKLPRLDSIELYYWRKALTECEDQERKFYFERKLPTAGKLIKRL